VDRGVESLHPVLGITLANFLSPLVTIDLAKFFGRGHDRVLHGASNLVESALGTTGMTNPFVLTETWVIFRSELTVVLRRPSRGNCQSGQAPSRLEGIGRCLAAAPFSPAHQPPSASGAPIDRRAAAFRQQPDEILCGPCAVGVPP
jgi:hypothetical protein